MLREWPDWLVVLVADGDGFVMESFKERDELSNFLMFAKTLVNSQSFRLLSSGKPFSFLILLVKVVLHPASRKP